MTRSALSTSLHSASPRFLRPLLLSLLIGCTTSLSADAGAVRIEKVLPFATDHDVRIEVSLTADTAAEVQLQATITAAGADGRADRDAKPVWQGELGNVKVPAGESGASLEQVIDATRFSPNLWTPATPHLYYLTVEAEQHGKTVAQDTVRFGFRSFTHNEKGQCLLNGKPIFLRGVSIGPPGRGLPESTTKDPKFAHDYVRFMKSQNLNLLRFNLPRFSEAPDPRDQAWFDACDELGVMVYQGNYGAPPEGAKGDQDPEDDTDGGRGKTPPDFERSMDAYKRTFETYVRHPSIVIYILTNEMPGPILSKPEWHDYLTRADTYLSEWDPTRLYIANAGYGLGREGDINDVHRYWGWYYNSFLTYYNLRNSEAIYGEKGITDDKPFTFSECVGSFTSAYGQFNHTFRKQLGAAQAWTGHSYDPADDALKYQAFMVKQALESFRRMREINPKLAGIMPFTILFYNWNGVTRFEQMGAKPAMDQMAVSYQPVLLSWEQWSPNAYTGATVKALAHIVNDADDFTELTGATLEFEIANARRAELAPIARGQAPIPEVVYFATTKVPVSIEIPGGAAGGEYVLRGRVMKEGKTISENETPLFIASRESWVRDNLKRQPKHVAVYDPSGKTLAALQSLGIQATTVVTKPNEQRPDSVLVIGEGASDASIKPFERDLKRFIAQGGRVLLLGQNHADFEQGWLPVKLKLFDTSINHHEYLNKERPTYDHMNINPERPEHPIFRGLGDRDRFHLWNDYSDWDQTKEGFPAVYPVGFGFKPEDPVKSAKQVAVIGNYDRGLEGVAVAELFDGEGSVLVTGFDLIRRIGSDPIADRVLSNLVAYLGAREHEVFVTVDKPIKWGDYATERGVITGPHHGLVVNCRWLPPPLDKDAKPLKDNTGAWNVQPGDHFIPVGRRPFGPWGYNANTAPKDLNEDSEIGEGFFFATLASPRKVMLTRVENPSDQGGKIEVDVNGVRESATIAPGKTVILRNAIKLPRGSRDLTVRIRGSKHLVMLETAFQ